MLSLSDIESGDRNVTVEVGDENSGKASNDKELGDSSSWVGDKSEMGKLSCLSAKVPGMTELLDGRFSSLNELNTVVEVVAASSVIDSFCHFLFIFKTENKHKTNWLTNKPGFNKILTALTNL